MPVSTYRVHAVHEEENRVQKLMKANESISRVDERMRVHHSAKHRKQNATNRFADQQQEDAFQAWSYRYFGQARIAMAVIIFLHIVFTFFTAFVFSDVDLDRSGSSKVSNQVKRRAEWCRWWYLIPAVPFVFVPRFHLDRRMLAAVVQKMGKLSSEERKAMADQQPGFRKALVKTSRIMKQAKLDGLLNAGRMVAKTVRSKTWSSFSKRGEQKAGDSHSDIHHSISVEVSAKVGLAPLVDAMPSVSHEAWKTFPMLVRHWKTHFALIVGVLGAGLTVHYSYIATVADESYSTRVDKVLAHVCRNGTRPFAEYSQITFGEDGRSFLLGPVQQTHSALVMASCALFVAVSQAVGLAVRLDYVQVMALGVFMMLAAAATLATWSIVLSATPCVLILITVGVLLCAARHMDSALRDNYMNLRITEFRNVYLREQLAEAEQVILHNDFNDRERAAVSHVLEEDEALKAKLESIRIPLEHLTLDKVIGKGAYGEVISGTYHGTPVVLKRMLRSTISEAAVQEFAKEILLMAALRHPNIVQFIGATWNTFSNIGFVLELISNGDLHAVLGNSRIGLSWSDPLQRIAVDTARGVAYLHAAKIIHRDLKSHNILVSRTYGAKVADFGLAKRQEVGQQNQTQCGTPLWTAPEIINGEPYTQKADVFSFGIVLSELLTRKPPYHDHSEGRSPFVIMMHVANDQLRPSVPEWCLPRLKTLIADCLAHRPEQRPTMSEALDRLQNKDILEFDATRSWLKMREVVAAHARSSTLELTLAPSVAAAARAATKRKESGGGGGAAPKKMYDIGDGDSSGFGETLGRSAAIIEEEHEETAGEVPVKAKGLKPQLQLQQKSNQKAHESISDLDDEELAIHEAW